MIGAVHLLVRAIVLQDRCVLDARCVQCTRRKSYMDDRRGLDVADGGKKGITEAVQALLL